MTSIGDRWRASAVVAARFYKGRSETGDNYSMISDIMMDCAAREEKVYRRLLKIL